MHVYIHMDRCSINFQSWVKSADVAEEIDRATADVIGVIHQETGLKLEVSKSGGKGW